MKHLLITSIFLVAFFCAASISVFPQSEKEWIAGGKKDDLEIFYRWEKSGSAAYEIEVKVINRRARAVDVIIRFEKKTDAEKSSGRSREDAADIIRQPDTSDYLKLTVKPQGTAVSEKIEIEGLAPCAVNIACWSNIDSTKKCDLEEFLRKKKKREPPF